MKVLVVHNEYVYPGGEDEVVQAEKNMLEKFGHHVVLYQHSNKEIQNFNLFQKFRFFLKEGQWSPQAYKDIKGLIDRENPNIVHVHNPFFLMTSSVYEACYDSGIPVVQTLHNYRFLCPIGTFYRSGAICEECLSAGKKSAIIHKCWKKSYSKSFFLVQAVRAIEQRKILSAKINRFIAPSKFCRKKYIQNGFDPQKIFVKPNFLSFDPGQSTKVEGFVLFIGSLQSYKGIATLMDAWKKLETKICLKIIGEGPLRDKIANRKIPKIEFIGQLPLRKTIDYIKRSLCVVVPSECYETFNRVIIESFACGVPVIASNIGALKELVVDQKTGFLFEAGSSDDLSEKITSMISDPDISKEMGRNARLEYEQKYTMEKNYAQLSNIYQEVIDGPK